MDISFLAAHLNELLENMQLRYYCKNAVDACKRAAKEIINCSEENRWMTFDDVCECCKNRYYASSGLQTELSSLTKIRRFAEYGELPVHQLNKEQLSLNIHSNDLYLLQIYLNEFFALLLSEGYSIKNTSSVRSAVGIIIIQVRTIQWDSFHDIRDWHENKGFSKRYKYLIN